MMRDWKCFLAVVMPLFASAAPFAEWFEVAVRPDGTVRLWGEGDEYSASFETEAGYAVRFDPSRKAYFYVTEESDGSLVLSDLELGAAGAEEAIAVRATPHLRDTSVKAREERLDRIRRDDEETGRAAHWAKLKETARQMREARKRGLLTAPPSSPTAGTVKGLTILVDFPIDGSDKTQWEVSHPSVTPEKLSMLLNGDDCKLYGNSSSVRSYFHDVSNGHLDYRNEVIGPILAPHPRTFYDDKTKGNGTCATNLIAHVFDKIKADPDFETKYLPLLQNLSIVDGKVRSLNIWFAGPASTEWNYGLWAHKWALYDSRVSGRLTFLVGGKTVQFYNYQITPVTSSPLIYTFCHENGHMLCGFPDLYAYEEDELGVKGQGAGYFTLMKGSDDSRNPPYLDPYLRTAAGWIEPQLLPSSGGTVTVRNNHADVWMYENPRNSKEYYLIENRQQTGRDASIRASGILIWRCNEAGDNEKAKGLPGFADGIRRVSNELSLEQADGAYHLEKGMGGGDACDAWYAGNKQSGGVFNDKSLPTAMWSDVTNSGLSLSDFSSNGETMTFKVAPYQGVAAETVPLGEAVDNAECEFSTSAKLGWLGQTDVAHVGGSAAKSGEIGHSQSSWMQTVVTGPGTLSFDWRVSSESGFDFLEFALDGETRTKISGEKTTWSTESYSIPEGLHELRWTYRKDKSISSGDDAGYVDKVVWKPVARVADPVIMGPSGETFTPPANVILSCATEGATIRYTLDGTDPTEDSTPYSGPIVITRYTEIRARAFKSGSHPSEVVVGVYQHIRQAGEVLGTEGIEWIDDPTIPWREEEPASMRAGGLGNQHTSTLTAKVKGRGRLIFSYRACIYSGNNKFTFRQNGMEKFSKTYKSSVGTDFSGTVTNTVTESSGASFEWTYKVGSTSADYEYYDYAKCGAWLYDVVWEPTDRAAVPVIEGATVSIFDGPREVAVSCATVGAVMRYTLDGSNPTEQSPLVHDGKIAIPAAATLKVRAFREGIGGSDVATARYMEKAEPGEWTSDAERVKLSAAIDGKLILFVRADCANSQWPNFEKAVNARTFRHWVKENDVYLVLRDDSDLACPEELVSWWTSLGNRGTNTTGGDLIPQFYLVNPAVCGQALASAYVFNGYAIGSGSVKFDKTPSSLISGIVSLLAGKGIELTACPTDNAAAVFETEGVTWINDSNVPWTEVVPDGQMRTGGLKSKTYTSTLTAKVCGPGAFRFSYRVCSYSNSNPASYSVNGEVKKTIKNTGVSYWTEDVVIDVGDGTNDIAWTYSVAATNADYTSGYSANGKSAWCGIWLYDVTWEPQRDPFPPVTPRPGQTEAEAVAAELAATFGADSEVVKRITTQEKLAEFNAFVKSCGIVSADEFVQWETKYLYSSFVLGAIMKKPALLCEEPKLEITKLTPADAKFSGGLSFTVKLDAGSCDATMISAGLKKMIRVGTDVNDIMSVPEVACPEKEGNPLTFTIANPGEKSGFIRIEVTR